jgi:predicted AlkP superfamily phosphohydrolase/phosphomutase
MSLRTLIIGLDGATFTIVDELVREGLMPQLAAFFDRGAQAPLRTIVPALTPPAWTSLMTGRTPGHHGVFDFFRMESPTDRHIRFFSSLDLKCETIFGLASASGLRATALNYPSMFPPPRLNGYVVPGWVPWKQLRLACWPEGLMDMLKALPGFNQRELAMDFKLEERTIEGCDDPDQFAPWISLHTRRERNWFEIFRHLTETDPSDLTAVLFDGVDKLQHLCWRFLRPEDGRPLEAEWEFRARDLCLEYFRNLDDILGKMFSIAGPEATVIIASDHGFCATRRVFHLNAWLAEHGYLAWSDAAAQWDTEGALLGVSQVARHTWMIDWQNTTAFAATPTSNGLYINVARDGAPGVPESEYSAFRERLMADLLAFKDPETGNSTVTRIWTREEVFTGECGAVAPDLTLELEGTASVSILPSPEVLSWRAETAGHHHPVGVFAAAGPGVRKGAKLGELSILDVAPLVMYSLGLRVPEDMQGRVPREIYEREALMSRPVLRSAATVVAGAAGTATATLTAEDEQVILDSLRDLGYIE